MNTRRFLPPIHLLNAFEAVARTEGFSSAARDLNLTQSAVSRQVKSLEEFLNISLFVRHRQKVKLTEAGKIYVEQIREGLKIIASASINLTTNPDGGSLNLAILPTFGTRWLAPRLPDFLAAAPGITLNLSTRMDPFDFNQQPLDAAIHFGKQDWPNTEMAFLMNESMLPVCSPDFKKQTPFSKPEDLQNISLLHISSRPQAWENWFKEQDVIYRNKSGMVFDQFATAANAARSGLGIALLPIFLIEQELKDKTLIPALSLPVKSEESYYLVWPKDTALSPPLIAFRDWLTNVAPVSIEAPHITQ